MGVNASHATDLLEKQMPHLTDLFMSFLDSF
jgi:hypothetical protein